MEGTEGVQRGGEGGFLVDIRENRSTEGSEGGTVEANVEGERELRLRQVVTMWGLERKGERTSRGEKKQQSDGQTRGAG